MNIIIQTGFKAISHNILFQPQTMHKGKQLVTAAHVRDVKEFRKCGKSYLITSKIIRQTSVMLPPYDTSLYINEERFVDKVSFTCMYNQSGKCKHVAALIYFINNEESLTKTSHEQQWGKPSPRRFVKDKYSKGKYFAEMYPAKTKIDSQEIRQIPVDLGELLGESALESVLLADEKCKDLYTIKKLLSSIVTAVEINVEEEDCRECLRNFFIFNEEFSIYSCQYELKKHIKNFYYQNIVIGDEDILNVCCQTMNQSQCPEWYEARRFRLSASSNIHNIKVRSRKSIDKLVNDILYPRKIDSESTNYGLSHENIAKEKYQELKGCVVKKVGAIVHQKQPWLCASIDGVVIEDGCITKLVELKCPITCKNKPLIDHEIKSCNVKYLCFENGDVKLKKNHLYYTQIQVQLYVTGMTVCDLFIYSKINDGCCAVPIHRDEVFLKEAILTAENFCFSHYLPATYLASNKKNNKTANTKLGLLRKRSFTGVDIINQL